MLDWSRIPPSEHAAAFGQHHYEAVGEPHLLHLYIPLPTPLGVAHTTLFPVDVRPYLSEGEAGFTSKGPQGEVLYVRGSFQFFQLDETLAPRALDAAFSLRNQTLRRMNSSRQRGSTPAEVSDLGTARLTIVEAVWVVKDCSETELQTALDRSLETLATFQDRHNRFVSRFTTRISRGSLEPFIAYIYRPFGETAVPGHLRANAGGKYNAILDVPDLPAEDVSSILEDSRVFRGDVFNAFSMLRQEARAAADQGNNIAASVFTGAAAETLLAEILQMLEWEYGNDPETTAKKLPWSGGPNKTMFNRLHALLGGPWKPEESPEMERWAVHVRDLRNRAAHSGYLPSDAEVLLSLAALEGLEKYIGSRLTARVEYFPMTTMIFTGTKLLTKRNAFEKWKLAYESKLRPPDISAQFARFKREVQRWKPKGGGLGKGRSEVSKLYRTDSEETTEYFLVDEELGLARRAKPVHSENPDQIREQVMANLGTIPITVTAYTEDHPLEFTAEGPWILAGDVIPTFGWRPNPRTGFDIA